MKKHGMAGLTKWAGHGLKCLCLARLTYSCGQAQVRLDPAHEHPRLDLGIQTNKVKIWFGTMLSLHLFSKGWIRIWIRFQHETYYMILNSFRTDNIGSEVGFDFNSVFDSATNFQILTSSKFQIKKDYDNLKPTLYLAGEQEHHFQFHSKI